jgi:kynurenine 3-monooxygenase
VTRPEAEDFVALEPGRFPIPQYARRLHARLGAGEAAMHVLLVGDAAHAFPPDLGLGVNAAFEDLDVLGDIVAASPDLGTAAAEYERRRLPESAALVRLVQTVFPYQYNQSPWRLYLWVAGFFSRNLLHRAFPRLVDKHAYSLSQFPDMAFTEMERRKRRTDRIVRGLAAVLALGAVAALTTLRA